VVPRRREAVFVRAGLYRQWPPAVKYRGIFINDEDWGLRARRRRQTTEAEVNLLRRRDE
jgi:hypothetical protein